MLKPMKYSSPLTRFELQDMHDEMLDECCDEIKIGNLAYSPSEVLKSVDPIAYRMSVDEYVDGLIADEIIVEYSTDYFLRQ